MAGFGYGHRSPRRSSSKGRPPAGNGQVVYGPGYGPNGPKQIVIAPWNQADVGYCHETNNVAENLPAKWASRGINAWKPGHPDGPLGGRAQQLLAAVKNANLMMIASPIWYSTIFGFRPDVNALDFRNLALNDPYWRVNWISYQISDEPDINIFPLSTHIDHAAQMELGGLRKPTIANFTRRVAIPSASQGSATIHFYEAFNLPVLRGLSIDSYEWHLDNSDAPAATETRSQPSVWVSPWNNEYFPGWPRFTASVSGLAMHMMANGKITPGRSDSGEMPVQYPPLAFTTPPYTVSGIPIPPQPMTYALGDKSYGHYVATGRVDVSAGGSYPRGGRWQPGRALRNEGWSGFVHGSSSLYIFPQTVGSFTALGYVDAATNTLHVTGAPQRYIDGAMRVLGGSGEVGWIRRDSPQLTGTPGGIGTYALDPAKVTPVNTGTSGSPVTLTFATEARPWGDDSNPENIAELTNLVANLNRMQAHPTGGNLMINTVNGGRRSFTVMRCPEINGDAALYKDDMTKAPMRAGYTAGGVPIPDFSGDAPLWDFGWPMGFEGFRVLGDDGAWYIYVRSMSNDDAPTWFPGYAALGLPGRVFGPFEIVGFRRVGSGSAVEMAGSSGVLKAGVDDGAATWFSIETLSISQNEGNSGTTNFNITVRRGGNLSGTSSVDVATSGTGITPAAAADFQGGVFPSGTLTFNAGVETQTFTAAVLGDTGAEFDETFKFTLSNPTGGAVLVASNKSELTATILNDDAPLASTFVWLSNSQSAPPSLPGSPAGAVHLNSSENSFVTRGGIKMRVVSSAFSTNAGFASVPWIALGNLSQAFEFDELDAGLWEFGVIVEGDAGTSGQWRVIDNPAGTATQRYAYTFPTSDNSLIDTDGTIYTNATTAVADAVNNLTFVTVTVSDIGGGKGRLRFTVNGGFVLFAAIALRKV